MRFLFTLTFGLGACSGVETTPAAKETPAAAKKTPVAAKDAHAAEYTCPMHPNEKAKVPGKCSKCGMDLVAAEKHDHGSHAH